VKPIVPREYSSDPRLHRIRQRIVRRPHVGELRLAALGRDHPGRQQRILPGRILECIVGVPQPVAQAVHPPPIVRRQHPALLVQV
jgi:hypothetical protein